MNERINSQQSNNFFFQLDCNFFFVFCFIRNDFVFLCYVVVVVAIFNHYSKLLVHKYTAGWQSDRQTDRPTILLYILLLDVSVLPFMFGTFFALVVIVRTTTNNVDDTRTHIHLPQKYTWRKEVLHYSVFLVVAIVFLCYPTLESLFLSFRVVLCWHFLLLDFEGNNFYVLLIILWLWKEINVLSIDMNKSTKRRNCSHYFLL